MSAPSKPSELPSINQMAKLLVLAGLLGAAVSLLTVLYLTVANWGETFFAEPVLGLPIGMFWPLLLILAVGLVLWLAIRFTGEHFGFGSTQKEFAENKGRINYRYVPSTVLQCVLSLWSGASVGPEGGLADLGGGFGTFIAEKLKIQRKGVVFITYCGVAGSFGAFFGNPVIGAFVAMEYLVIEGIPYLELLIPGFISATVGYLVYFEILHTSVTGFLHFPPYAGSTLVDLVWALLIGVIGGFFSVYHKILFAKLMQGFGRLKSSPLKRVLIGAVVVGVIGSFIPLLLYSGQRQIQLILSQPAVYTIGFLVLLLFAKSFLMAVSFNSAFKGGPVFPLLFMGGTLGLAITGLLPFIPEGVGVTSGMAAVAAGLFPLPISIILLVALMSQLNLLPTIIISAITGFLISRFMEEKLKKRLAGNQKQQGQTQAQ